MEVKNRSRLIKGILIGLFFLNLILGVMGSIPGIRGDSTLDAFLYCHPLFYTVLESLFLVGFVLCLAVLFFRKKYKRLSAWLFLGSISLLLIPNTVALLNERLDFSRQAEREGRILAIKPDHHYTAGKVELDKGGILAIRLSMRDFKYLNLNFGNKTNSPEPDDLDYRYFIPLAPPQNVVLLTVRRGFFRISYQPKYEYRLVNTNP